MCMGCASPVRLAISHNSVAPSRGVSVAETPRPFDVEPGTRMVVPSRLPFHLVLLTRLSTGVPAASGEPGPSGLAGFLSPPLRKGWRRAAGPVGVMLTIGAAPTAGGPPAPLEAP